MNLRRQGRRTGAAVAVVDVASLATALKRTDEAHRAALQRRIEVLLTALDLTAPSEPQAQAQSLADALDPSRPDLMWLALAVLTARLPTSADVERSVRAARLDGPIAGLAASGLGHALVAGATRRVDVITGAVVVDVHHASRTPLSTGIQRVTRETTRRWQRDHKPVFVQWDEELMALTVLAPEHADRTVTGAITAEDTQRGEQPLVVPWRCTYLLPELHSDVLRADHLHGLLRFSGNRSGAIGFDCVPISTAETVIEGMSNGFALGLAALAHADRICPISHGAEREFRGWRSMLAGTGLNGPDILAVPLPVEAGPADAAAIEQARDEFVLGNLPMVLVVGSHEPRKNHLAVLHASELLWREGQRFTLVFVGGSAWHDTRFRARLTALQQVGRAVHSVDAVSDKDLWAAYRLARFTLFPSLNEGFGLPVAESLAVGTPVITSRFGSMAEIAADGGALLVDPRNDHDIAAAMRRLLTDDVQLATLREQAAGRSSRTWNDYAGQVWTALVSDAPSSRSMRTPAR